MIARVQWAFQVLQGSVETLFRWGGKRLHHFIANLFRKPFIKFHENRPRFVWDITKNILVSFFRTHYMLILAAPSIYARRYWIKFGANGALLEFSVSGYFRMPQYEALGLNHVSLNFGRLLAVFGPTLCQGTRHPVPLIVILACYGMVHFSRPFWLATQCKFVLDYTNLNQIEIIYENPCRAMSCQCSKLLWQSALSRVYSPSNEAEFSPISHMPAYHLTITHLPSPLHSSISG